jgi:magnesium transporter
VNPTAQLLEPEVRELILSGDLASLREALHGVPPADTADILAALDPKEAAIAFRVLQRDDAGAVFAYFTPECQQGVITALGAEDAVKLIEEMSADDRAKLIDEMPAAVAERIVRSLSPESRKVTQAILGYPPKTVGRLMTPDFVKVRANWTVQQAIEHIRKVGRDAETVNVVYVVDDQGVLTDDLRLRQLLFAEPTATIQSIMNHQFVTLRADMPQGEAVQLMQRYDRVALPVVDSHGAVIGIVTIDDVADVAEEQATESMQKLGGVAALAQPYIDTPHFEMFRKRGVWLAALFIGQTITIIVLGGFQQQLDKAAVLVMFLPLVISCGGNSGSQAATLVTRALGLGEIAPSDWWRIVRREIVSALLLGATLSVLGWLCVEFFTLVGHAKVDPPWQAQYLAASVAASIFGVVLWGVLVGSLLPLGLKRLGVDPATASSPMVATLMDASGTLIYLGFAILVLTGTLL